MSKSWIIFFSIVGFLILIVTGIQIMFFVTPQNNQSLYNPAKANPIFQVEVLQKVYDNQKWILINNNTLEPNVVEPFTPPTSNSSSSSSGN